MDGYLVNPKLELPADVEQAIIYVVENMIKKTAETRSYITIIGGNNDELILFNCTKKPDEQNFELDSTIKRIITGICRFNKITIKCGLEQTIEFTKDL